MIDLGKRDLLGVMIDAIDYDGAVARILDAAREGRPFGATALAVHGVMTGAADRVQRHRLNSLDLVTPDGQPVRWALNWIHGVKLDDRVYGPTLLLRVCEAASAQGLAVYLYGSSGEVVDALAESLRKHFPNLVIAGAEPSVFRRLEEAERVTLVERVRRSGARMLFAGLGCPRQESFVYELRKSLPMPVIAVGAAFDYHSGLLREPAPWIQRAGLQWLHRLVQEPRRLWKRYLILNTTFLARLGLQLSGVSRLDPTDTIPPSRELLPG